MRKLIALLTSMLATTAFSQGVIDVHAHLLPTVFVEALKSEGRLMDEGFPLPKYDVENHLKWMDEAGVEVSVLTLAAPQMLTKSLARMKQYLSDEPDLAPFREMILYQNAHQLLFRK